MGVNDYETQLFENLWPLPKGISYNSFLIVDEKVALIDTVKQSSFPPSNPKGKLPSSQEADVILKDVNVGGMDIPLDNSRRRLEVELEHGVMFVEAHVTNNHPILTGKIVARLKEAMPGKSLQLKKKDLM